MLGVERVRATETLFCPALAGVDQAGLVELIQARRHSISHTPLAHTSANAMNLYHRVSAFLTESVPFGRSDCDEAVERRRAREDRQGHGAARRRDDAVPRDARARGGGPAERAAGRGGDAWCALAHPFDPFPSLELTRPDLGCPSPCPRCVRFFILAVVMALDPSIDAWRGAAAAVAAGHAGAAVAVTRQEYEECGADCLRRKGLLERYY